MSISLRELAGVFLRIGNLTLGGGNPTVAALYRELVQRRGCLPESSYVLSYGLARVTPGTNVLAFCAAAGWFLQGWRGSLTAVFTASAPSAALAVWLSYAYEAGLGNRWVATALAAVVAAVVGLMAANAIVLLRSQVRSGGRLGAIAVSGAAFLLSWRDVVSPVGIVGLAALAGLLWPAPRRS